MDELKKYQSSQAETEAEAIVRRERELSTKHVIIDLLQQQATFVIPDRVLKMVEKEELKIGMIKEYRESKDPNKNKRFPVGKIPVLDLDKLVEDIQNVKQTFLNEPISKITTTVMETKLQWIFEQFLNYSETYTKYI